jgi:uncharacterized membrane protein YfcA
MAVDGPTILVVIGAGVAVGILSALFGVGGGILMVPFLLLALDQTQHIAEGTSLAVIVPTAIAGVLAHRRSGFVSFSNAAWLAAGGIGGAWLGAEIALGLDADILQVLFALFLLLSGIRMLLRGLAARRTERAEAQ